MENKTNYQLALDGAKFYEEHFVPNLFKGWAQRTIEKLALKEGDRLLDIACGTGIVARVAEKTGINDLDISGCDINDGMLEVAKSISASINWVKGRAENLPFESDAFDKIVCQFGFMFFEDHIKALEEMRRIKRRNGKIIISIWNSIKFNEGYFDLLQVVEKIGGKTLGRILKSPFFLGELDTIYEIIKTSKVNNFEVETIKEPVQFRSIDHWIDCDVKASPIVNEITTQQFSELKAEANTVLKKYTDKNGAVKFNMSAHIITIE